MGVDLGVTGFHPPDDKWRQMKAAWDACKAAGVAPPASVSTFFGDTSPDERGIAAPQWVLEKTGALTRWRCDWADGYEIDLAKLPKNITVLRVYLSC